LEFYFSSVFNGMPSKYTGFSAYILNKILHVNKYTILGSKNKSKLSLLYKKLKKT